MIDWTTFPVRDGLTALALFVAGLSLWLSWLNYQRDKAEKSVNGWITLQGADPQWTLATLYVKNNSHLNIQIEKLTCSTPFRVGDPKQINKIPGDGGTIVAIDYSQLDHHLAMPFGFNVAAG